MCRAVGPLLICQIERSPRLHPHGIVEVLPHDSDHFELLTVEHQFPADNVGVRTQVALPEAVRDDRDLPRARVRVLLRTEQAASLRQRTERLQVVPTDGLSSDPLGLTSGDVELIGGEDPDVREHRLRVFGSTILPGPYTSEQAGQRSLVNTWLRTQGTQWFDGVFDFATALGHPEDETQLDLTYDSGDGLHPNDTGYQRMAEAVDLIQLTGSPSF